MWNFSSGKCVDVSVHFQGGEQLIAEISYVHGFGDKTRWESGSICMLLLTQHQTLQVTILKHFTTKGK